MDTSSFQCALQKIAKDRPPVETLESKLEELFGSSKTTFRKKKLTIAVCEVIHLLTEHYLRSDASRAVKLLIMLLFEEEIDYGTAKVAQAIDKAVSCFETFDKPTESDCAVVFDTLAKNICRFKSFEPGSNTKYFAALTSKLLEHKLQQSDFSEDASDNELLCLTYLLSKPESGGIADFHKALVLDSPEKIRLLVDLLQCCTNPLQEIFEFVTKKDAEISNPDMKELVSATAEFLRRRATGEQRKEAKGWLVTLCEENVIDTDPQLFSLIAMLLLQLPKASLAWLLPEVSNELVQMLDRSDTFSCPTFDWLGAEDQIFHRCGYDENPATKTGWWCSALERTVHRLEVGEIESSGATFAVLLTPSSQSSQVAPRQGNFVPQPTAPFVNHVLSLQKAKAESSSQEKISLKQRLLDASKSHQIVAKCEVHMRGATNQRISIPCSTVVQLPESQCFHLEYDSPHHATLVLTSSKSIAQHTLDRYIRTNLSLRVLLHMESLRMASLDLPWMLCSGTLHLKCMLAQSENPEHQRDINDFTDSQFEVEMGKKLRLPRVTSVCATDEELAGRILFGALTKLSMLEQSYSKDWSLTALYFNKSLSGQKLLRILSDEPKELSSYQFNLALLCCSRLGRQQLQRVWTPAFEILRRSLPADCLHWWGGFLSFFAKSLQIDVRYLYDMVFSTEDETAQLLFLEALTSAKNQAIDLTDYQQKLTELALKHHKFVLPVLHIIKPMTQGTDLYRLLSPTSSSQSETKMLRDVCRHVYTTPLIGKDCRWSSDEWIQYYPVGNPDATDTMLFHCANHASLTPTAIHHYCALPQEDTDLRNLIISRIPDSLDVCIGPLLNLWLANRRYQRLLDLIRNNIPSIIKSLEAYSALLEKEFACPTDLLDKLVPLALQQSSESAARVIELRTRFSGKPPVRLSLCDACLCGAKVEQFLSGLTQEQSSAIEELDLGRNEIGDRGAIGVAQFLQRKETRLRKLSLCCNGIGSAGVFAIASALRQTHTCLQLLELSMNDLDYEAACAIAELLLWNTSLTSLSLYGCSLANDAILPIIKALRYNSTLRSIDLNGNDTSATQFLAVQEKMRLNKEGRVLAPHLLFARKKTETKLLFKRLFKQKPVATLAALSGGAVDICLPRDSKLQPREA